jgi:hypothetical protein
VKYINHLNAVIAIVALVIIAHTLGRTFFDGAPATPKSIEVPSARARVLSVPQPVSPSRVAPVFPAARQPLMENESDDPLMPIPASSALPGAAGVTRDRGLEEDHGGSGGNVISIGGDDGRIETPAGTQTPSFPPRQFGQRPFPRDSRVPGYVPPPFNDGGAKRQPSEGLRSSPPVRSSMPEQRIR